MAVVVKVESGDGQKIVTIRSPLQASVFVKNTILSQKIFCLLIYFTCFFYIMM